MNILSLLYARTVIILSTKQQGGVIFMAVGLRLAC
jgi:hypothetical protein